MSTYKRIGCVFLAGLLIAAAAGFGDEGPADTAAWLPGVDEIVFAVRQPGNDPHWYANFGYFAHDPNQKAYGGLGRLCVLNVRTGEVRTLLDDPKGTVRDPQVHYDAAKILFSYRKGDSDYFHLYEIGVDGSGLRAITDGPYDDIEPTYLPDGDLLFVSSRCNRWVNCWMTQVAILYRCDGDGAHIRPVSGNTEQDNTPWPLPDGRILYMRWEYVDRSQVDFHHLWSMNPDGTDQMTYFGNMHPSTLLIDAKPIPGTDKVVTVLSPGHGMADHNGKIAVVSPATGPDDLGSIVEIPTKSGIVRDPYALSADRFIAAQGPRLYVFDGQGNKFELYKLEQAADRPTEQIHEPRPIMARPRERVVPPRVDLTQTTGLLLLQNIYDGRNMKGVERGEIKKLLVLELLPKPINHTGGMHPITAGGSFTLERILGTVPVEPDGSAYIEVPALRSLFFVALDENNLSVKRMHSFLSVMPGETSSCVGCHEPRTQAPRAASTRIAAPTRPPSRIEPIPDIPDVFDFPRDIQPILDKHCVKCHDYDKRSGKAILTGDRNAWFSHAYATLSYRGQLGDGRNRPQGNYDPRAIGTSASPLMKKILGKHHDVELSAHEIDLIRYWLEAGATYPGTYASLGSGMIGEHRAYGPDTSQNEWPETKAAGEVVRQRCRGCHENMPDVLPVAGSLYYNLTRPELSLVLLAPLAKEAGGYGLCLEKTDTGAKPVFADKNDAGYQSILALAQAGQRRLETIKRFDMPGFRPSKDYIREMQRYGILPPNLAEDAPIDCYKTDRAYWESLWWRP